MKIQSRRADRARSDGGQRVVTERLQHHFPQDVVVRSGLRIRLVRPETTFYALEESFELCGGHGFHLHYKECRPGPGIPQWPERTVSITPEKLR